MPIDCAGMTGREGALCRQATGQPYTGEPVIPPQQVFVRTNSRGETEIGFTRGVVVYPLTGRTDPAIERVVWVIRKDGSARQTLYERTQWDLPPEVREYTAQEFELLRVFGSLGGVSPIPKSGEWNADWPANRVPITDADKALAVEIIKSLSPAEIVSMYYSLWNIIPPKVGQCGKIQQYEVTTPRQASDDTGYGKFQWPIMASIYKLRPELREIYDPATREKIPGLLPPDQLPQIPCLVGKSQWDLWADLLLSAIGAGFPGPQWVNAIMSIVKVADQIRTVRDANAYAQQMADLSSKISRGAEVIVQNPPPPELEDRANGKTPSQSPAMASSILPWILAAAAAIALS